MCEWNKIKHFPVFDCMRGNNRTVLIRRSNKMLQIPEKGCLIYLVGWYE